ncbi:4936_t:CDS:1 [Cetraspora pellucida]|uniref:4936_t:CDS:1 n=1 Tax=Cetraspora pellucida TaxID=1433469 RepID=A0ACA9P0Z7_9GLOM|nr:4936_t:CDS:1 [Cetraspora pellucida]
MSFEFLFNYCENLFKNKNDFYNKQINVSKKALIDLPNEVMYTIFDMLCIDCKNAKYFIYILVSRFWAKYFIPKLWSNVTRDFNEFDQQSVKAWNQILKWSFYYDKDDETDTKNSPLFNYLKYIEELSFFAIDLYCNNMDLYEIFEKDKFSMIIRRNVIRYCKILKYLDTGIKCISDKDWKENYLNILFVKIGPMTDIVITGVANLRIKERIFSDGINVKSIEYRNILHEKRQLYLQYSKKNNLYFHRTMFDDLIKWV